MKPEPLEPDDEAVLSAFEGGGSKHARFRPQPDSVAEPPTVLRHYIEPATAFLAETDPPVDFVVSDLVPSGALVLFHGEPRTRKTWAALELAVAVATATPAFGLDRFAVPAAVPVLYSSQEDDRRRVRDRLRRYIAGRGLTACPPELLLSIHGGINLEDEAWQEALLRDVGEQGIRLVIFDPIRRYSPNVDKGPSEVRATTAFLRRLAVETGASVVVVHHDVKPGAVEDTRRRGHRASGGDWFAASDCPVHFEPAGKDRTLVVPEDFKFVTDPESFTFRLEEDGDRTWVRVTAQDVAAENVGDVALHERILDFLAHSAGASGSKVAAGVRKNKTDVLGALDALSKAGKVDSIQKGRAVLWFLASDGSRTMGDV